MRRNVRTEPARVLIALLLFAMALPGAARAAVTAEVDRTRLAPGETVELRIRVDGDTSVRPDLAPLEEHFDILSRSQSAQTRIINWKREEFREWTLVLAPKRDGVLVIPPIRAGNETTRPITLRVAAGQSGRAGNDAPVQLETEVEPQSVHVQEQFLLIVRVVHRNELEGNLTEPEVDGAVVEKIGDQRTYAEVRNGVRYRITERRYAVFPQRSGTLEIPSLVLTGTLHQQSSRFGFNPFGPTQNGRTVRLRSEPQRVEVLPRPGGWPADQTWLPAQALSLSARWTPEERRTRTGEPLVLQVTTEARGLDAAQIPAPRIRWPDGLQVYPDKAVQDNQVGQDGITGTRVDRYTVIPSRGGRFRIGEIRLPWWNTTTDTIQTARIAATELQIDGPVGAPPAPPSGSERDAPAGTADIVQATGSAPAEPGGSALLPWMLCVLLALGWATTTWFLWRRRPPDVATANVEPATAPDRHWYVLARACRENDPRASYDATLAWLRGLSEPVASEIRRALHDAGTDPALAASWEELGRQLYAAQGSGSWDGLQFFQAVSNARKRVLAKRAGAAKNVLPALYPTDRAA